MSNLEATIYLNSIDKVKNFVQNIAKFDCEVDIFAGKYIVDGKSIMGVFSLPLTSPLKVKICGPEERECYEVVKQYTVF